MPFYVRYAGLASCHFVAIFIGKCYVLQYHLAVYFLVALDKKSQRFEFSELPFPTLLTANVNKKHVPL